ncbi:MAG TPA: DmsC/YnfH family molybdoenzyme membrane anchor subunit [Rhizobiaceae bacterium]|nr:DmsC/YnfH family molybdoenzyme membrane anchor subunit [Rhizobiaceae bacterium]
MHPAPSIIVFTTLSGLGYGLAAVLGLGLLDPAALSTEIAHVLALALIAAGLSFSTLHLGNPQRAWRAFSQWRSSWLSREGVLALVTFVPLVVSAWGSVVEGRYMLIPGLLGTLLCAAVVYCTAMIYASLKSIDAWHTPLTPVCYLLFSAAGGLLLAGLFSLSEAILVASLFFVAAAWSAKRMWWTRLATLEPLSTPESATGLGAIGRVRLFERPHINDNYLTREMGFRIARKHAATLERLAVVVGGLVPGLLVVAAMATGGTVLPTLLCTVAALLFVAGILMERWLFFATARHAVMNYYGG